MHFSGTNARLELVLRANRKIHKTLTNLSTPQPQRRPTSETNIPQVPGGSVNNLKLVETGGLTRFEQVGRDGPRAWSPNDTWSWGQGSEISGTHGPQEYMGVAKGLQESTQKHIRKMLRNSQDGRDDRYSEICEAPKTRQWDFPLFQCSPDISLILPQWVPISTACSAT